jgi:hypothetical protein
MWRRETARRTPTDLLCASRRGAALVVVMLLVAVLSAFTMTAVSYLLASTASGRDSLAEARAMYLAELGRADASAYIDQHPAGPWPHTRPVTAVPDDQGASAGQYSYVITDLTLPMQNQRRLLLVHGFWPSQASPMAQRRLQVWMERQQGAWTTTAYTIGECGGS